MKTIKNLINKHTLVVLMILGSSVSCTDLLNTPLENEVPAEGTDYSQSENMELMLIGAYADFNDLQWETFPLIAVRGDDVNPAGDQVPLTETDAFRYDRNFWIYNSVWLNLYTDVIRWQGAIEEIQKYQDAGANASLAQQYIAEIKVLRGFEMLQLARLWGNILIPRSSNPADLYNVPVSSFNDVMAYISDQMDEAIPLLPNIRPNQRTDVRGGVTRFTALAVKAMVNLELHEYQIAADATSQIISSNLFTLQDDYYELFKVPGKLDDENLLELQYSDLGSGSGTSFRYLWDFFGPASWTPAVAGSGGGWGFWEPSVKYIKFMLDRGEEERLQATVIFTPAGISDIQADPNYADLPDWISNTTPDGDVFNNHPRYKYMGGKFYLPSNQLTPGRTAYGENKNFACIRYAEVLLMHAEALVNGATSTAKTADAAVNEVRNRVGLLGITGVDLDDVLDEKYAEFGTEWGIRFADLIRYDRTAELTYDGRVYPATDSRFLPYPLEQQDILPQLRSNN